MPIPPSTCITLDGAVDRDGYVLFSFRKITRRAHRVSWEIYRGEIPAGMLVCHSCDNRCCVNPGHLFLGTNRDNVGDMVAKGRQAKGERHGSSKLKAADVLEIGALMKQGCKAKAIAGRFGVTPERIWQLFPGR